VAYEACILSLRLDSRGEVISWKPLTQSWKSNLIVCPGDLLFDGDPVLMVDTISKALFVVTGRLGGAIDRAVVGQRLIGEYPDSRRLYWDRQNNKPELIILTELGNEGGWMAARAEAKDGPGFRVEYAMPTDDQWLSPIQMACLAGFKHVSVDLMDKIFRSVSPDIKIPSGKQHKVADLLKMFGGKFTDDVKEAILAGITPAPKQKGKKDKTCDHDDYVDPLLAKVLKERDMLSGACF